MIEIFNKLPDDLQRCVMGYVGATPTAEIIKEYYYNQKICCDHYWADTCIKGDFIVDGWSFRYRFQHMVFKASKELYKNYKHIDLTDELGEWVNEPRCEHCEYPLSLKDFQSRGDYGELSCSDCYGVNSGIIGDFDEVSEYCNNCEKTLVGEEWRYLMDKGENCGMCFHCIEMDNEQHGDSDVEEEEENISDDDEN
jgi:hypothetical protein